MDDNIEKKQVSEIIDAILNNSNINLEEKKSSIPYIVANY